MNRRKWRKMTNRRKTIPIGPWRTFRLRVAQKENFGATNNQPERLFFIIFLCFLPIRASFLTFFYFLLLLLLRVVVARLPWQRRGWFWWRGVTEVGFGGCGFVCRGAALAAASVWSIFCGHCRGFFCWPGHHRGQFWWPRHRRLR